MEASRRNRKLYFVRGLFYWQPSSLSNSAGVQNNDRFRVSYNPQSVIPSYLVAALRVTTIHVWKQSDIVTILLLIFRLRNIGFWTTIENL